MRTSDGNNRTIEIPEPESDDLDDLASGNNDDARSSNVQCFADIDLDAISDGVIYDDRKSLYEDKNAYRIARSKKVSRTKWTFIIVLLFIGMIIACLGALSAFGMMTDPTLSPSEAKTVSRTAFEPSSDDIEELQKKGYDARSLTDTTKDLLTSFLTVSSKTVNNGEWLDSFEGKCDLAEAKTLGTENMLVSRTSSEWKKMVSDHSSYSNSPESFDSIEWSITDDGYARCDAKVIVVRPELDSYELNSPVIVIDRFVDTYRVLYNSSGKSIFISRFDSSLLNINVDANASSSDRDRHDKEKAKVEREQKTSESSSSYNGMSASYYAPDNTNQTDVNNSAVPDANDVEQGTQSIQDSNLVTPSTDSNGTSGSNGSNGSQDSDVSGAMNESTEQSDKINVNTSGTIVNAGNSNGSGT